MTSNYNHQRTRNCFLPDCKNPFKISRTKIQNFLDCPLCFYLDRRCGTAHPGSLPFTLNCAVDTLLKAEFDQYRTKKKPHPLMIEYGIAGIPFLHPDLEEWRANFKGIQVLHEPTNLIITGAIDDLWINSREELIVVDYKATSTSKEITLDEEWRKSYKNQMGIYQWLLRKKGYKVSNTGYFVYCNGNSSKTLFEGRLEFTTTLIPYEGNDSWVESELFNIHECLKKEEFPKTSPSCAFCNYREAVQIHLKGL